MKKILSLLCVFIAAAAALAACGPAQETGEPRTSEDMAVVADMDGQHIYMYELAAWLKLVGLEADVIKSPEYRNELLDYFMNEKVTEAEVKSQGYYDKLTEEQLALADSYAQYHIQNEMQSGLTEEEVFEKIGMSKEELIEQYKINVAGSAAFEDIVGEVSITDDELKAEFDKSVAGQKELMEKDAALYVQSVSEGATVYYKPAGVRMARRILISFDDETLGAIQTLRQSGYDKQAELIRDNGLKSIQSEAEKVLGELTSGMKFGDALEKYNDDKEMGAEGYPVAKGTDVYHEEFTQAAMALGKAGETSGLVASDEGYQIIEYTSELAQGSVDFESVKEIIRSNIQPKKQSDKWEAKIEQWKKDHKVVCYYDNLPTAAPSVSPSAKASN